ncbi:unnamed protein product [Amoebophrya sp. A120]|nr:unnamed protein product [Amoebophrya sp. A120]|eukprot:GSA120T00003944001.1
MQPAGAEGSFSAQFKAYFATVYRSTKASALGFMFYPVTALTLSMKSVFCYLLWYAYVVFVLPLPASSGSGFERRAEEGATGTAVAPRAEGKGPPDKFSSAVLSRETEPRHAPPPPDIGGNYHHMLPLFGFVFAQLAMLFLWMAVAFLAVRPSRKWQTLKWKLFSALCVLTIITVVGGSVRSAATPDAASTSGTVLFGHLVFGEVNFYYSSFFGLAVWFCYFLFFLSLFSVITEVHRNDQAWSSDQSRWFFRYLLLVGLWYVMQYMLPLFLSLLLPSYLASKYIVTVQLAARLTGILVVLHLDREYVQRKFEVGHGIIGRGSPSGSRATGPPMGANYSARNQPFLQQSYYVFGRNESNNMTSIPLGTTAPLDDMRFESSHTSTATTTSSHTGASSIVVHASQAETGGHRSPRARTNSNSPKNRDQHNEMKSNRLTAAPTPQSTTSPKDSPLSPSASAAVGRSRVYNATRYEEVAAAARVGSSTATVDGGESGTETEAVAGLQAPNLDPLPPGFRGSFASSVPSNSSQNQRDIPQE